MAASRCLLSNSTDFGNFFYVEFSLRYIIVRGPFSPLHLNDESRWSRSSPSVSPVSISAISQHNEIKDYYTRKTLQLNHHNLDKKGSNSDLLVLHLNSYCALIKCRPMQMEVQSRYFLSVHIRVCTPSYAYILGRWPDYIHWYSLTVPVL